MGALRKSSVKEVETKVARLKLSGAIEEIYHQVSVMINVLLKLASVLTPEDIKKMKDAGCSELAEAIVNNLEKLSLLCCENKLLEPDGEICIGINTRLYEFRAMLNK